MASSVQNCLVFRAMRVQDSGWARRMGSLELTRGSGWGSGGLVAATREPTLSVSRLYPSCVRLDPV